jgi:hypothetical protein
LKDGSNPDFRITEYMIVGPRSAIRFLSHFECGRLANAGEVIVRENKIKVPIHVIAIIAQATCDAV